MYVQMSPAWGSRAAGGGYRNLRGRVGQGRHPPVGTHTFGRSGEDGDVAGAHVVAAIVVGSDAIVTEIHAVVELLQTMRE